ncbi:MAG TPA: hypothetical protein VJN89_08525 [Candidatus Acidoferrum sp.]|nr:hypothetical protein [Candidatus Acidoferrum sp.]
MEVVCLLVDGGMEEESKSPHAKPAYGAPSKIGGSMLVAVR